MNADPRQSLSPVDPALVTHLTEKLGPPKSVLLAVSDGRDMRANGWTVGHGSIDAPAKDGVRRGTDVTIILTEGGHLVTSRVSWTRTRDGSSESASARVNPCPQAALEWLIEDGGGKLGRASKDAWAMACRTIPAMATFEYEQIE